ncbi:MAG: hypothetical protein GEU90_12310 [Gemmatimonas sp.]|nr:hypothetical protein [Gemmatimonas sp.]
MVNDNGGRHLPQLVIVARLAATQRYRSAMTMATTMPMPVKAMVPTPTMRAATGRAKSRRAGAAGDRARKLCVEPIALGLDLRIQFGLSARVRSID